MTFFLNFRYYVIQRRSKEWEEDVIFHSGRRHKNKLRLFLKRLFVSERSFLFGSQIGKLLQLRLDTEGPDDPCLAYGDGLWASRRIANALMKKWKNCPGLAGQALHVAQGQSSKAFISEWAQRLTKIPKISLVESFLFYLVHKKLDMMTFLKKNYHALSKELYRIIKNHLTFLPICENA